MPCRDCGRPGFTHCPECRRRTRGTTTTRGYGHQHRAERAAWARRIDADEQPRCRRCDEPVLAGQAFDLGHSEDRTELWPEHRRCNRATNRSDP